MTGAGTKTLLHLVYIHGFQGNDTTFQSFPTDLQQHLLPRIPERYFVASSVYPTYKSAKPLRCATRNFLEWLATQPPGPVIVLGHSMGGLLAADAATHPANKNHAGRMRIVAVIAFDTPYIGMHPRVVITGIASLLPKNKKKEKLQSDKQMNDETHVTIVDEGVTDDWEAFKNANQKPALSRRAYGNTLAPPPTLRTKSSSSSLNSNSSRSSHFDRALSFVSANSADPVVRWLHKHGDEPFTAPTRWIIEHFQFGVTILDPAGLKERYSRLVHWEGSWVNYWTEVTPKGDKKKTLEERDREREDDNDVALLEVGISVDSSSSDASSTPSSSSLASISDTPSSGKTSEYKKAMKAREKAAKAELKQAQKVRKRKEKEEKKQKKEKEREEKKLKSPRHFIVLPTGLGASLGGARNWEKVQIAGVEDEVEAHCGLFIQSQNLDYDGLVERVGQRVLDWCERP